MLSFRNHQAAVSHAEDISHYKALPNTRYGTNPAAVHEAPNGEKHYVKFYNNPEQAHAEVTASHLMEKMGAQTLKPRLVQHNGRIGVATKWRTDLKPIHPSELSNPSEGMKHELAKHYVAGVVTKNWDTVGMEYDNLMKTPDHKLVSVDQGGALHFRAQGGPKPYSKDIAETKTYHDKNLNHAAAHAFSSLGKEHIKRAYNEMSSHTHEDVHNIFKNSGLPNHKEMADTFNARHALLGKHLS